MFANPFHRTVRPAAPPFPAAIDSPLLSWIVPLQSIECGSGNISLAGLQRLAVALNLQVPGRPPARAGDWLSFQNSSSRFKAQGVARRGRG